MSCCDETTARVPATDVSRRSLFKGAAMVASVIPAARPTASEAQGKQIKLAYCSQLLCGVPYEVARSGGIFKNHRLDVQLVYTRGGTLRSRRWSAARSITLRPRSTLLFRPMPMSGRTSAALRSPGASPCLPLSMPTRRW